MLKHWLLAARPKTLVASILPVCCGFLLAREQSSLVSPYVGLLCLFYCFAIQVGTNFANDFFDYKKDSVKGVIDVVELIAFGTTRL